MEARGFWPAANERLRWRCGYIGGGVGGWVCGWEFGNGMGGVCVLVRRAGSGRTWWVCRLAEAGEGGRKDYVGLARCMDRCLAWACVARKT